MKKLFSRFGKILRGTHGYLYPATDDYVTPTAPTIPQNLVVDSVTDNTITFSHSASGDTSESGVKGYKTYTVSGGVYTLHPEASDLSPTLTHTLTGLTPGVEYTIVVTAYNHSNLESDYSSELVQSTTNTDSTAPVISSIIIDSPPGGSLIAPVREWVVTDDIGVTGYYWEAVADAAGDPGAPAVDDPGWTTSAPTTVTLAGAADGDIWCRNKDAAGNITDGTKVDVAYNSSAAGLVLDSPDITSTGFTFDSPVVEGSGATVVAPSGLTAEIISPTWIRLGWTAPAYTDGYTSYSLERNEDGGAFSEIATPPIGASDIYDDTEVSAGITWGYKIRSLAGSTYSASYSNIVYATPEATTGTDLPAATITGVSEISPNIASLAVTLPALIGDTVEYQVTGVTGGSPTVLKVEPINTTTPPTSINIQISVTPGATYFFFVKAGNGVGDYGSSSNNSPTITMSAAAAATRIITFDTGTLGASAVSSSNDDLMDFDGTDSIIVDFDGHRCARAKATALSESEDRWGGSCRLPTKSGNPTGRAVQGDTIIVDLDVYYPTEYDMDTGSGGLKFLRIGKYGCGSSNCGWLDFGFLNPYTTKAWCDRAPQAYKSYSAYYVDSENIWASCGGYAFTDAMPIYREQWIHYQWGIYLNGEGSGKMWAKIKPEAEAERYIKLWWAGIGYDVLENISTLNNASTYAETLLIHNYWNSYEHDVLTYPAVDQYSYIDNIQIQVL